MKKYRVILNGRNFKIESDGKLQKVGFYTTRWVQAETPQAAELEAIDLVRQDSSLKVAIRNLSDDPPMIYLDALSQIESFDGISLPGSGYSFYQDEDS